MCKFPLYAKMTLFASSAKHDATLVHIGDASHRIGLTLADFQCTSCQVLDFGLTYLVLHVLTSGIKVIWSPIQRINCLGLQDPELGVLAQSAKLCIQVGRPPQHHGACCFLHSKATAWRCSWDQDGAWGTASELVKHSHLVCLDTLPLCCLITPELQLQQNIYPRFLKDKQYMTVQTKRTFWVFKISRLQT